MKVIGLLGGVASGKSSVADALARRGAVVLNADAAGHDALRRPDVKEAIRNRWGERVFETSGEINRRAVAEIVFADAPQARDELVFLESLTHPIIAEALLSQLDPLRERVALAQPVAPRSPVAPPSIAVLDAAVMLKAGWDRFCDHMIFVDAPRDARSARARNRGWTEEQFAAREAAQESVADKRACSDHVVNNSGTPAELESEVERLMEWLVTAPARNRPDSPPAE